MKNTLSKYYPNLTAKERFQLAIKAASEKNENECDLLSRTCPKKVYRINDPAFTDRIITIEDITAAFVIDIAERYGKLSQLIILKEFITECFCLNEDDELFLETTITPQIRSLQKEINTLWEGFSIICQENANINPEIILKAFYPPAITWLEESLIEEHSIDEEMKKNYLDLVRKYWVKRIP